MIRGLGCNTDSSQACWNCGRLATETCSGCGVARYCGAFCQHKDWDGHARVCRGTEGNSSGSPDSNSNNTGENNNSKANSSRPPATTTPTTTNRVVIIHNSRNSKRAKEPSSRPRLR